MTPAMWAPSIEQVSAANLQAFLNRVGAPDYQSLYRWSIDSPAEFWGALRRFVGVKMHREASAVVEDFDRMPGARWFPGAELSFAENLLRYRDDREALVFWSEKGDRRAVTYEELFREVGSLAGALSEVGVSAGDRVAGFVANTPEAVAAMLATTSLGAIWSSCSPDFGAAGVIDRFGQIKPKVLFAVDGYSYGGKRFDCLPRVRQIADAIDSIERVVVVPYSREDLDLSEIPNAVSYDELREHPAEAQFPAFPFDHPAYILYSSGTTGAPKCIVHGAGGTLLQHLKELVLHTDLKREDRILYFTSCGWMMWNWLVSSLAVGATAVLYDGSPFHPGPERLFDIAEQERLTVFGTSAKYIAAIEKEGLAPARSHRLESLRAILSTGSPLPPESFDYVYEKVKPDVRLSSISGGTDLISCFALGNPISPVYRGELQTAGLGMRVEVFDDAGRALGPGKKGELVCTQPFPSMPVGFWNDPDGGKYSAAYFERFPGVWHHGDYCERTDNGGFVIWGRSDTLLNPGGVRIGTAEIYGAVESMPEVVEAVAVGLEAGADMQVVLFVRLPLGEALDDELAQRIRRRIREHASPRHLPTKVIQVADIPRTRSGKIAELAVKNMLHGRPVNNRDALANPESLELYRDLPELSS